MPLAVTGAGGAAAVAGATAPVIFSFAFFPIVPRAVRVAARFTTAAATVSAVVCFVFGVKPKSATIWLLAP